MLRDFAGLLREESSAAATEARPWGYWFCNNANGTSGGITTDLDAMQRVGIGGGIMDLIGVHAPMQLTFTPCGRCTIRKSHEKPTYQYRSPRRVPEAFRRAFREAPTVDASDSKIIPGYLLKS